MPALQSLPLVVFTTLLLLGTLRGVDFRESTGDKLYDDGQGNTLPYRLFKPMDYCADTAPLFRPKGCDAERKFPLVVFFHGSGERGTDNRNQASGGSHMLNLFNATNGKTFDGKYQAFLLTPQCPTSDQWVNHDWGKGSYTEEDEPPISKPMASTLAILNQVIANYEVDTSRIYVTGLSMGGYGTWDALRRRPELFAAAMPLSGGGNKEQGATFKDIPVWSFHGSLDSTVPVSGADAMRDAIANAGGLMEYTRIEVGHEGWGTFYDNRTFRSTEDLTVYQWLFSQSQGSLGNGDYEFWAAGFKNFTDTAAKADPDGDGLRNRDEYAFGLNPTKPSKSDGIQATLSAGNSQFRYTRRDPELTKLSFRVQVSTDLMNWEAAVDPNIKVGDPDSGTHIQEVTVTLTEAKGENELFVRVKAE
jgi:predicted esterase